MKLIGKVKNKNRIPHMDRDLIAWYYFCNWNMDILAEEFDTIRSTVYYWGTKKGVKHRVCNKLKKEDRDLIAWNSFCGFTLSYLAEEYDVTCARISQISKEKGFKDKYNRYFRQFNPSTLDSIGWDYYKYGKYFSREIINQYGIDRNVLFDLGKKKNIVISKITHDGNAFNDITPESAYWIGFLAADGCVYYRHNNNIGISIGLQLSDIGHLRKFRKFLKSNVKISISEERNKAVINIVSSEIGNRLINLGIVPNKSHILQCNEELRNNRDYWRGLIDGDGYVSGEGRIPEIELAGTKSICEGFRDYCRGILNTSARVRKKGPIFSFKVTGNAGVPKIISDLYGDASIYLDRKYKRAMDMLEGYYLCYGENNV